MVGEERNSAGAYKAAQQPRGSRYIINGEPTENKLALGSKGALRYEVAAAGKMAHSAYPELGDSAIHKLLDALAAIRRIPLPVDALLGPSTLNIGTLSGGRAPNVIADEARADIMIRLVGDSTRNQGRRWRRAAEGLRRTARGDRDPRAAAERGGRHRNHGGGVHHRYSRVRRRVGRAVPASGPAPSTWRTRSKSACPNGSFPKPSKSIRRMVRYLCKRESK